MTIAFWYWLVMAIWLIWGIVLSVRARPAGPPFGPFYWGAGWTFLLFLLFLLIGLRIFPDPLSTLVRG